MPMHATVMGSNMEPLSDDFEITNDDFSEAEETARQIADNGTKCCIRWSRTDDGQVGYWGPAGAVFEPRWYVKMGRPTAAPEDKTRPHTVYTTDAQWAKVQERGHDWLRALIDKAK